jgi:RHS repeat-associated protein
MDRWRGGDNTYVYGLDPSTGSGQALISATDGAGVQTYHLYDGLGSTTDLTDGSGTVTAGYGYDVFGEPRSGDPESATFLFTGEQYDARARDVRLIDADTGLYYLRARYYDPSIGRFLTQDPVPAVNLYAYVGNNPVNYVDPAGLCHKRLGWDQICGRWAHELGRSKNKPKESSTFQSEWVQFQVEFDSYLFRCGRLYCADQTLDFLAQIQGRIHYRGDQTQIDLWVNVRSGDKEVLEYYLRGMGYADYGFGKQEAATLDTTYISCATPDALCVVAPLGVTLEPGVAWKPGEIGVIFNYTDRVKGVTAHGLKIDLASGLTYPIR